jgi:tRNA(Leu) C34 or U34 (ribose-2'-O)-methylase TrmL
MGFTMDMSSSHQAADHDLKAGREDEIIFFGRATEIIDDDIDQAYQHQLSLPLFISEKSVHYVT